MEGELYMDNKVARLMNGNFVSVKVDRKSVLMLTRFS